MRRRGVTVMLSRLIEHSSLVATQHVLIHYDAQPNKVNAFDANLVQRTIRCTQYQTLP
jgi:hypothetical protein